MISVSVPDPAPAVPVGVRAAGIYPARPLSNTANTSQVVDFGAPPLWCHGCDALDPEACGSNCEDYLRRLAKWEDEMPAAVARLAAREWPDRDNPPVGVQPEPAGGSRWCEMARFHEPHEWQYAARPAHCPGYRGQSWPVPVVHPEPGDRAEDGLLHKGTTDFKLADALLPLLLLWGSDDEADEDVDQYDITNAAINHLRQRPSAEFALLFPSQAAAAVAAVRADTALTLETKAHGRPMYDLAVVEAARQQAFMEAAAIVRGETS